MHDENAGIKTAALEEKMTSVKELNELNRKAALSRLLRRSFHDNSSCTVACTRMEYLINIGNLIRTPDTKSRLHMEICRRNDSRGSATERKAGSGRPKPARSVTNVDRVEELTVLRKNRTAST